MKKYTVIIVQGYEMKGADGSLFDLVSMEFIEDDPKIAIKRAKQLIKKKEYRVSNIIERFQDVVS